LINPKPRQRFMQACGRLSDLPFRIARLTCSKRHASLPHRSFWRRVPSNQAWLPGALAVETPPPSFRKSPGQRRGHLLGRGSQPHDDASLRPRRLHDDRSTRPMWCCWNTEGVALCILTGRARIIRFWSTSSGSSTPRISLGEADISWTRQPTRMNRVRRSVAAALC